jgi:small-conductance mechanosensitive channel
MLGRLFDGAGWIIVFLVILNSIGRLTALSAIFAAFGGMFLGWALQSPVSGVAAWILISLKRPFRPGDRILFPTLGLVGDVKEIGVMYTILNQVGGSVGSEEAVGRDILIPNAMLFSQVVINYTVKQESPYILDEVVVRITYDSDWDLAEQILIKVATEVTKPIIEATRQNPYVRMDMYDYGVFMRLRYMTLVTERVKIASDITRQIYREIQKTDKVDIAIPFIYSYKAGKQAKNNLHLGTLPQPPSSASSQSKG